MAITINDQPYTWTPRGQKLIYDLSSDNTGNIGFKFGISVEDVAAGKTYDFYLDPSPDGHVYFDLNPLVNLRNAEGLTIHATTSASYTEPEGNSWRSYNLIFTEWWIIGGVLTQNEGVSEATTTAVYNGYLQPTNGYRPNVFASSDRTIKICNNNLQDYLQSDRQVNTHVWPMAKSFGITPDTTTIFIPTLETDYGLLFLQGIDTYSSPNNVTRYLVQLTDEDGATSSLYVPVNGDPQEGIPVGPQNLKNSLVPSMPDPTANGFIFYKVSAWDASARVSKYYIFYNAEKYGQFDCRYTPIRVAWVCSRGGWDYQNFIKKNEVTNQIERKQYKRVLFNGTGTIFTANDRQQFDRQNVVTRTLTINSDWLQENEYIYLRSLMASNQVEIINTNGTSTPVSVEDTSFLERREKNGKLYNITLKLSYSQDYWS
jgi:hypothetical protein